MGFLLLAVLPGWAPSWPMGPWGRRIQTSLVTCVHLVKLNAFVDGRIRAGRMPGQGKARDGPSLGWARACYAHRCNQPTEHTL